MDRVVRLVIGSFQLAVGAMRSIGPVMEAAMSEGATEAFVEKQEQQRNVDAFGCESIGIASAVTLEKLVP